MDTYFVNVTEKGSQGKPVEMERDGGLVFCRSFQSDFTNEMDNAIKPNEPEATDILSYAS